MLNTSRVQGKDFSQNMAIDLLINRFGYQPCSKNIKIVMRNIRKIERELLKSKKTNN